MLTAGITPHTHLIAVDKRLHRLHTDLGHLDVYATLIGLLSARHMVVHAVSQIRQLELLHFPPGARAIPDPKAMAGEGGPY